MGLSENLTQAKSELEALLTYANETTGAEDTRLGDAVRTLASGFGQGGGTLNIESKTITANGSDPYELTFTKAPRFVSFTTGATNTVSGISLECIGTVDFSSGTKVHTAFWAATRTYCQIIAMLEGTKVTLYFLDQSGSSYLRNKTVTVTGYYLG